MGGGDVSLIDISDMVKTTIRTGGIQVSHELVYPAPRLGPRGELVLCGCSLQLCLGLQQLPL